MDGSKVLFVLFQQHDARIIITACYEDKARLLLCHVSTTRQPPSKQFIPIKHLKISCQLYKIGYQLLSSRFMPNYTKACSFLHAHYTET